MAEPDPVFDVRYAPTPQIGTIVAGTHDPATLASAYLSALGEYAPLSLARLASEYSDAIDALPRRHADLPDLVDALHDALADCAPPYTYFGAHVGDGADYGYWIDWDAIEQAVHDGDIERIDDLSQASGTRDAILINDHGNVTLYTPNPEPARIGYARELMTEVWSIV